MREANKPRAVPLSGAHRPVDADSGAVIERESADPVAVSARRVSPFSAFLAITGAALCPLPVVYLHMSSSGQISPVDLTVSDYVSVPHGGELLAVSILSLVVSSLALLAGLAASAVPRLGAVRALCYAWCLGLVTALVFPTDPIGSPISWMGVVHRYAGGIFFACVPVAGWLLHSRFRESPHWSGVATTTRRLAMASGVISVAFLLSHVPATLPGLPGAEVIGHVLQRGVCERVLLLTNIWLMLALGVHLLRLARDHQHTGVRWAPAGPGETGGEPHHPTAGGWRR
ncbi:DUF998 domain-containing protein [Goodfellowiella coeruleoviolacea]|nr:DUF998 domain-containing protein [Goodfellowiella coeruleoviolacea]